jgi:hypothetical protein
MKDFSNAAFAPEVIEIMTTAFEAAVATLSEPVHSAHVTIIAGSILRTANTGERDAAVPERIALRAPARAAALTRTSGDRSALLLIQNLKEFLDPLERLSMSLAGVHHAIAVAL